MSPVSPFLSDDARAALRRVHDADALDAPPPGLERVRALRALQAALEQDPAMLAAVRDAQHDGADWSAIAEAAELTPAAARWRWSGDDEEIAARHAAGRRRAARPSSKPDDLPGMSVAEAAQRLGITVQAVYNRVARGGLRAETVELPDGRRYKRVHLQE